MCASQGHASLGRQWPVPKLVNHLALSLEDNVTYRKVNVPSMWVFEVSTCLICSSYKVDLQRLYGLEICAVLVVALGCTVESGG